MENCDFFWSWIRIKRFKFCYKDYPSILNLFENELPATRLINSGEEGGRECISRFELRQIQFYIMQKRLHYLVLVMLLHAEVKTFQIVLKFEFFSFDFLMKLLFCQGVSIFMRVTDIFKPLTSPIKRFWRHMHLCFVKQDLYIYIN